MKRNLEEVLAESFSYSRNAYTDATGRSYLTANENLLLRLVRNRILKDLKDEFGEELKARLKLEEKWKFDKAS